MKLKTLLFLLQFPMFLFLNIQAQDIPTVVIGNQVWMMKNIDTVINNSYCFDMDTLDCTDYGRLYPWETALKICPAGFHLPSDEEWTELTNFLGGLNIVGRKLLIDGSSGFDAPLAGNYKTNVDILSFLNKNAYFWTSTSFNTNVAWLRQMSKNQTNINRTTADKEYCFSVRCIKDKP